MKDDKDVVNEDEKQYRAIRFCSPLISDLADVLDKDFDRRHKYWQETLKKKK